MLTRCRDGSRVAHVNLKDYEFSQVTMNNRWQQGLSDARTTLQAAPWLAPTPQDVGVRVFDVMHDVLVGKSKATPQATSPMEEISAPGLQKKDESVPEEGKFRGTG